MLNVTDSCPIGEVLINHSILQRRTLYDTIQRVTHYLTCPRSDLESNYIIVLLLVKRQNDNLSPRAVTGGNSRLDTQSSDTSSEEIGEYWRSFKSPID